MGATGRHFRSSRVSQQLASSLLLGKCSTVLFEVVQSYANSGHFYTGSRPSRKAECSEHKIFKRTLAADGRDTEEWRPLSLRSRNIKGRCQWASRSSDGYTSR